MNFKNTLLFFLYLINIGCNNDTSNSALVIQGRIENLPDGQAFLYNDKREIIAKTNTKKGKFIFNIPLNNGVEPIMVTLEHIDQDSVRRIFGYKTKLLFHGQPHFLSTFMLEDGIKINSKILDFKSYTDKLKIVYPEKEIITGEQTTAYFSEFYFDTPTFSMLKKSIKKFPTSYYLLHQVQKVRSTLTQPQLNLLLDSFNEEVKKSRTGNELKEYHAVKVKYSNLKDLKFRSENGDLKPMVSKIKKINLIILWASWCVPCRKEIPTLKKIYQKYKTDTEFIMLSISLDSDISLWRKALAKEKMNWEQLIITPDLVDYQQDIFQFDGSIPMILFVNSEGEIVSQLKGYEENEGLERIESFIAKLKE